MRRYLELVDRDFAGEDLSRADLRGALLIRSCFRGANFRGATLRGACVRESDFTDADFTDADLTGLREADMAHWSEGFDWRAQTAPPAPKLTEEERLARVYFDETGKLKEIPVGQTRQRFVMERLVAVFEHGVQYPEKEVNAKLYDFHPDFATLRRYLIDHRLMARENNIYWRTP